MDQLSESDAVEYSRRLWANTIEWYRNADTKAQILLGLNGILVAAVAGSVLKNPSDLTAVAARFGPETWVSLGLTGLTLAGSVVSALLALWSRTASTEHLKEPPSRPGAQGEYPPRVMWYFQFIAALDLDRFARQLAQVDQAYEIQALASQIHAVSKNVTKKHAWVNRGVLLAGLSLLCLLATTTSYIWRLHA
jgi:hypothetical protein